jgi:hypothetical protein
MSHGGSGGGMGHVGGMHGAHHGSIQGTNVDPNWTGTTVRSQEGDWMWRWFNRLSPGQVGGLFFLGFILWLFVVYHTSHPAGAPSKLADLNNFPSAKYENTLRAASGQQAWDRDPTKLKEHPTVMSGLPQHSARLFSNIDSLQPQGQGMSQSQAMAPQSMLQASPARMFSARAQSQGMAPPQSMLQASPARMFSARAQSQGMTPQFMPQSSPARMFSARGAATMPIASAPPVPSLPPAEDLLTQDVKRPYKSAFGKAREDILPQESVYAAPGFNLIKKEVLPSAPAQEADVSTNSSIASAMGASSLTLNMLTSRPRVDMSSAIGEIADGRIGNSRPSFATRLNALRPYAANAPAYPGASAAYAASPSPAGPGPAPKAKPTVSSNNTGGGSIFHTVTQANADGLVRTKLVVTR